MAATRSSFRVLEFHTADFAIMGIYGQSRSTCEHVAWLYSDLGHDGRLAFVIGACAVWLLNYGVKPSTDAFTKWFGLTFWTLLLFGFVIKQSRRFWRSRVFWATMGTMLIVHTGTFLVILRGVEHWRMFFVVCTMEIIPISGVLDWSMLRFGNRPRKRAARNPHPM